MDYQEEYLRKNPTLHVEDAPNKLYELKSELAKAGRINTFLDAGCGTGTVTNLVFEFLKSEKATGLDISENMIKSAMGMNSHPRINFICRDILNFRPAASFDAVISTDIIEHVPDDQQFIRQILNLGNICIIRLPLENSWINILLKWLHISDEFAKTRNRYGHIHHYSLSSFSDLVHKAGGTISTYSLFPIIKPRSWWLNEVLRQIISPIYKISLTSGVKIGGGFLVATITSSKSIR